jgi:ligand-binding sensor domain-containing protein
VPHLSKIRAPNSVVRVPIAFSGLRFSGPAILSLFLLTTENGLPQNSIQALLQTHDGYLWMSTLDGLVRFDGLRFRIFNRQNTPALTTNGFSFFALLEDRQGCLWAGTLTGGVIRYCNGAFTSLTVKDGLPNNTVVRIDEDEAERFGSSCSFTR